MSIQQRYALHCPECGIEFDTSVPQTYCAACASPILAEYDLDLTRRTLTKEALRARPRGLWRWQELLPVLEERFCFTLGEGDTPLLSADRLGAELGFQNLYIKDESGNATGSFKARGLAAAVSKAVELGIGEFVIPTAGNAGSALAAYAARSGTRAHVYMPLDTPRAIQAEVQMYGADLHLVQGLISDAAKEAAAEAKAHGWFDVSTFKEPFRVEGKKTMGFELAEAFKWTLPDVIIYPTGGGTGLVGMWKAFRELEALGWIAGKRPRMVTVQASGCAPVVRAFTENQERTTPWQNAATIAYGLRVPNAFADRLILRALRESGGTAISVSDEELLQSQKQLGALEGLFAAPEGAATAAAAEKLLASGFIKSDEKVVLFNTGSGLKYVQ
jgi:threonine synthase